VFNKDVKVPLQEAELVGTSSSNMMAIGIVLLLLLSPIATPAIAHCCHRRPSPQLSPIAIALPSRLP
jgi:hypothetical protein